MKKDLEVLMEAIRCEESTCHTEARTGQLFNTGYYCIAVHTVLGIERLIQLMLTVLPTIASYYTRNRFNIIVTVTLLIDLIITITLYLYL